MRRRLAWTGAFMIVAGGVAGLIVAFPSPPPQAGEKLSPGGELVPPSIPAAFAPRHTAVLSLAQKFILTAVARKNVKDSWELVCPEMRAGYTRASWAKGDIPVVPYPVSFGKWRLSYSFEREVDLQVALYAKPKKNLNPVVFDLTVQRCGNDAGKRWLVSSFLPTPSGTGDYTTRETRLNSKDPNRYVPFAIGTQEPPPVRNRTSGTWLFLPGGIVFGLIFVVLSTLGIRAYRGKRLYKAHVRERQMSSSRPS
jgi:hypothetical protein